MPKTSTSGQGRPKGAQNKITADVKAMILGALNSGGGQAWLERQMDENPVAFMTLVGKVLPMTVAGDKENPLVAEIRRVVVDPRE